MKFPLLSNLRLPTAASLALGIGFAISSTISLAGEADVIAATAQKRGDGTYGFSVTVQHADEGWEHYANVYEVVAPDGTVLGTRVLAHPHVDEQPFTRSLGSVEIPAGVSEVIVRAGDSVHGLGGKELTVKLDQ